MFDGGPEGIRTLDLRLDRAACLTATLRGLKTKNGTGSNRGLYQLWLRLVKFVPNMVIFYKEVSIWEVETKVIRKVKNRRKTVRRLLL